MDLLQVILLALIQGLTEFLPISSSAHLILPKDVLGWPDQGLAFDVAVHVGTLAAVLLYFRRDVWALTLGWCRSVSGGGANDEARQAWFIIAATVPAALFGLVMSDIISNHLRSIAVIAATTIVFGVLLGLADRRGDSAQKTLAQMTLGAALVIGLAQALALIPGTSRSGITITAALFLGFSRVDSAKFSFLMSIPIIVLSGAHEALGLAEQPRVDWAAISLGVAVSAISAYLCIYFFLGFINRLGMMPFVIYRLLLGGFLITLLI